MDTSLNNVSSLNVEKKQRNSNLELFRIITMVLIVAHHYVTNSGLTLLPGVGEFSAKNIFMWILGAYGKIGINCFVLITGYFMCKSKITLSKFLKLLLEVEIYRVIIYLLFLVTGLHEFSWIGLAKAILPVTSIQQNFTSCFLIFYLCIPFLNILVKNMNEKMHIRALLVVTFTYIIIASIPKLDVSMNYVSWFIVLYLIASYIRLYPKKIFDKVGFWAIIAIISVLMSAISVVVCLKLGVGAYFFVSDCNKLLAVATGLSLFMFFKNLNMKNSKVINAIASTSFGVLLIHANSETMRKWLWGSVFKNCEYYYSSWFYLHAIFTPIIIFAVCMLIDLVRIYLLEKPFFKWWDNVEGKLTNSYQNLEAKICEKLDIDNSQE